MDTQNIALNYRYTQGDHVVGVEINRYNRFASGAENTDAYKLSFFWTYNFNKVPSRGRQLGAAAAALAIAEGAPLDADVRMLVGLAPGSSMSSVEQRLADAGVFGATILPGVLVYELPLISGIVQRQRLALVHSVATLSTAGLIIDFNNVGDLNSTAQTYERVREVLIREYGSPTTVLEQGKFGINLFANVNSGGFIRVMEWATERGVLRFGIPRRLDGQVRMEIQYGRGFPPPNDTLWSIEEVR